MKCCLLIPALVLAIGSFAQTSVLGTKTLYAAPVIKQTPVPSGFQPLLINHIGRHGARHLTKMPSSTLAYTMLMKADSLDQLTTQGKSLKAMVTKLNRVEADHVELISKTGEIEQQGIAARMAASNAALFADPHLQLQVSVAKKKRTVQTADAFLSSLPVLQALAPAKLPVNDTILRFYDLSPAYLKYEEGGAWKASLASLKKQLGLSKQARSFISRLFLPAYCKTLDKQTAETMMDDVFGFAQIVPSLQEEIAARGFQPADLLFLSYFNSTQLKALTTIADTEDYYTKGPGSDVNGIQVKIAAPLLADFIRSTDQAIQTQTPSVLLRFGHAETVAPFAALLGIKNTSELTKPGQQPVWQTSQVIPLSANIQWIVYQNATHDQQLVKFLLNEREVAINGLKPFKFPYYRWADVRTFYLKRLNAMGASIPNSGYNYLLQLK